MLPKGRKNKVPPTVKAIIKEVLEEVARNTREEIRAAMLQGHQLEAPALVALCRGHRPLRRLETGAETVKLKGPAILPPMQIALDPRGLETDGDAE